MGGEDRGHAGNGGRIPGLDHTAHTDSNTEGKETQSCQAVLHEIWTARTEEGSARAVVLIVVAGPEAARRDMSAIDVGRKPARPRPTREHVQGHCCEMISGLDDVQSWFLKPFAFLDLLASPKSKLTFRVL